MKNKPNTRIVVALAVCALWMPSCSDSKDKAGKKAQESGEVAQNIADNARREYEKGLAYMNGTGVGQDFGQAAACFRRAAEQGMADAQYMLGTLHIMGLGVAEDVHEGMLWLRKAADQGHQEALRALEKLRDI